MSTLGALLTAAAGPLAKRVMTALGFGVVSFVGVDLAVSGLLSQAQAAWGGMSGDVAAYVALSGANTGLSILAGAIVGRVALTSLKRFMLL
jgi:hypothetical protein